MAGHRIFGTSFASIYPHYVAKAERKGHTKAEVEAAIRGRPPAATPRAGLARPGARGAGAHRQSRILRRHQVPRPEPAATRSPVR